MSAKSGRSLAVRRCAVLAATLAAIGASLAALPHPRDLAATAAGEPPPPEDLPTITVTGERAKLADHPHISLPVARAERPGETSLSSIGEFVSTVQQLFGSQATSGATRPSLAGATILHSEGAQRPLPGQENRYAISGSRPAPRTEQVQSAGSRKTAPALSDRASSLAASASSSSAPHSVSGVLDYIVNRHSEGIRVASSYGFYTEKSGRPARPQKPRSAETFADRVSTTLQMFSVTPGQRPAT